MPLARSTLPLTARGGRPAQVAAWYADIRLSFGVTGVRFGCVACGEGSCRRAPSGARGQAPVPRFRRFPDSTRFATADRRTRACAHRPLTAAMPEVDLHARWRW